MKYSEEQLIKEEFIQYIIVKAEDCINEDRFREAYDIGKELEEVLEHAKDLKENYHELYEHYQEIAIKLEWIGLPIMTENNAEIMFKNYFTYIFLIPEFDIWQKIKTVLLNIIIFEDRDNFKNNLKNILLKNNEKITSQKLIVNKKEVSPTIGNWLNDYNISLGLSEADKVAKAQYLINGDNVKKLNQKEKNKIKILFNLYEKLKLSSLTLEGLEEDIPVDDKGREGVVRGGIFEPFKETEEQKRIWDIISGNYSKSQTEKDIEVREEISKLETMASNYKKGGLEQRAIEDEINKKKKFFELEKVRDQFPANSLESKAVEEEMEMLEKK